jgi:hypothetical protein
MLAPARQPAALIWLAVLIQELDDESEAYTWARSFPGSTVRVNEFR